MGSGSAFFDGSGRTIFVGSWTKICRAFGIKDQNLGTKMGSAMKKHISLRPYNMHRSLSPEERIKA